MRSVAAMATIIGLLLTACSEDPGGRPTSTNSPAPGTRETAAAPATGTPRTLVGPPITLEDVQVSSAGDRDNVTFKFDKSIPDHQLRFLEAPPSDCASGVPVEVAGSLWLEIEFRPAAAHDDSGQSTVAQTMISSDLPAVVAAAQTCDSEGTVTWALGLPDVLGASSSSSTLDSTFVLAIRHP